MKFEELFNNVVMQFQKMVLIFLKLKAVFWKERHP